MDQGPPRKWKGIRVTEMLEDVGRQCYWKTISPFKSHDGVDNWL